jgi:exopolysaccharide biosynthesis polyprenyl glycosylphosphotransferase
MLRRHGVRFRTALMLFDAAVAAILLVALSILRFGADWSIYWRYITPEPIALPAVLGAGWVAILASFGLYRPRARLSIRSEAVDIAKATAVLAAIALSLFFVFRLPDVSRLFLLGFFPALAAATLLDRVILRIAFRRLRASGRNTRYVLVVGAGPRGQAFAAKLEDHRELGLEVTGFLDDEPFELPRGWRHLGSLDEIERVLHEGVVDEVVICLPFSQWDKVDAISQIAEDEGKIVRVPMDVIGRAFSHGRMEELDGTAVFSLVNGPDRAIGLALKRSVDVVGAVLGLLLMSPVLAVVAIGIRRGDGGPAFFRQIRIGLHGREFTLLKFRTMTMDAEARRAEVEHLSEVRGPAFKIDDDPRVTRFGRVLRRLSIDELPQLWNVLRGDMSLVGPRPALPSEVQIYDIWHRRRLSMKPGITGLWQVRARRNREFDDRAQMDLEYIDHWSIWLDFEILARTIPAAVQGR